MIRRREFIAGLGGAAVAWPTLAHAQQGDRVRRIGVLFAGDENDPVWKTFVTEKPVQRPVGSSSIHAKLSRVAKLRGG